MSGVSLKLNLLKSFLGGYAGIQQQFHENISYVVNGTLVSSETEKSNVPQRY